LEIRLCVPDSEVETRVEVEELVRRLEERFPGMSIDRKRGDALIQQGLDELISRHAPEPILESHRSYFGRTIYVSICEERWNGACASSYLTPMYAALGDCLHFEITDTADPVVSKLITDELKSTLRMVLCSELRKSV
jgi:hypothetical protein